MTILQAIHQVDALIPNTCPQNRKVDWLSQLDGMLHTQTLSPAGNVPYVPYDPQGSGEQVLLAQPPFDRIYPLWLEAQIHYFNGEITRYNNAIALFNTQYSALGDHHLRSKMPPARRFR